MICASATESRTLRPKDFIIISNPSSRRPRPKTQDEQRLGDVDPADLVFAKERRQDDISDDSCPERRPSTSMASEAPNVCQVRQASDAKKPPALLICDWVERIRRHHFRVGFRSHRSRLRCNVFLYQDLTPFSGDLSIGAFSGIPHSFLPN